MKFSDFLRSSLHSFFIIVTLINIATFALGSIFRPEQRFGYDAFISPVLNGLLSMLPVLIMYSKKEFTLKQLIFRKLLQLALIEVIIVGFASGSSAIEKNNLPLTLSLVFSILIIYLLVHIIEWYLEERTARKLNDMLKDFQSREESIMK